MKKLIPIIAILLTLVLAVGCGGNKGGAEKTVNKFLNALMEEDYEKATDCFYPAMIENVADEMDIDAEDFAKEYFEEVVKETKYELKNFEIIDVDVEDDCDEEIEDAQERLDDSGVDFDDDEIKATAEARVEIKDESYGDNNGKHDTYISLIKVGSKWYISDFSFLG